MNSYFSDEIYPKFIQGELFVNCKLNEIPREQTVQLIADRDAAPSDNCRFQSW